MQDSRRHWSRREWLTSVAAGTIGGVTAGGSALSALAGASSGAATAGAGQSGASAGPPLRRLGVQLYTVRDQMKDNAAETLKAIASIGYKEIELGRADLARLVPLAKNVGLNPVSTHIEAWVVTGAKPPAPPAPAGAKPAPATPAPAAAAAEPPTPPTDDSLKKTFDEIRSFGPSYAVVAYLFKGERPKDAAGWTKFAEQMNRAGKFAKNAGLTLGYHNHGFEFEKLPDGQRPLDILLKTFDPSLVRIELDVYWVGITGADPVALIKQLGKKIALLHLKDKDAAAPPETDEGKVARTSFKEVGSGGLDFPAILKAASSAGVQHLFVEQDSTPGDPIASLKQSYDYLSKLKPA